MIERRIITQHLTTLVETTGKPVGLGQSPTNGGWQGQPNTDGTNFTPYVVINPNPASAPSGVAEGPISGWQADWKLSYTISSFGVMPEQTEWMADAVRILLDGIVNMTIASGSNSYMVQQVRVDGLGGLVRVDATEPPYWGQSDQISIWLSEE
jgi:hypothetical protein